MRKLKAKKVIVYDWNVFKFWLEQFNPGLIEIFEIWFKDRSSYSAGLCDYIFQFNYKDEVNEVFLRSFVSSETAEEQYNLFMKNFGKFHKFGIIYSW